MSKLYKGNSLFNREEVGHVEGDTVYKRSGLYKMMIGYIEGNNVYKGNSRSNRELAGCVDGNTVYKVNMLGGREELGCIDGNTVYKGGLLNREQVGYVDFLNLNSLNLSVTKELTGAALLLLL